MRFLRGEGFRARRRQRGADSSAELTTTGARLQKVRRKILATLMDEMVITDGNREAFEAILSIGRDASGVRRLFVWGPKGSGKSTVASARGREKDLLSTKRIVSCHAQEIVAVLKSGVNEGFLDEIGDVDVLLIDGFESFFGGDALGPEIARLLIGARNARGLATVVISDEPRSALDATALGGALDGFEELEVQPLDADGQVAFAQRLQEGLVSGRDDAPALTGDALRFIAIDFAKSPDDIRSAVRFLLTKTEEAPGSLIGVERARRLLGA